MILNEETTLEQQHSEAEEEEEEAPMKEPSFIVLWLGLNNESNKWAM